MDRRNRITARLVRQGDDEKAFDAEFWSRIPPDRRVELIWDMVLDWYAVQGREVGDELRLQRSVATIQRP